MGKKESFYNLIDYCIEIEGQEALSGNGAEMFRKLLIECFFQKEITESRKIENMFKNMKMPAFLQDAGSILEIDIETLSAYIQGEMLKDSLSGGIYTSSEYLKIFYPHHAPSFGKLPSEVQQEILNAIKSKNKTILEAFEKLKSDSAADKSRKVLTLIALVIKNVHLKTGFPLKDLGRKSEDTIRGIFGNCDEVYRGQQRQQADLDDDKKVKQLIKEFFVVKKFQDIADMAELFKAEFERYRKRALRA
ncbi:MAG: hypothetical protein EPN93_05855 [Spirochaetes bacterium]|nr:MAG: hypothetical protein EPN93_05855 [Spirochaetota bacterium]